jgi:hypothetical protein
MYNDGLDQDLHSIAHTIADLSRGVEPDSRSSARLRQELLRRHQEQTARKSLRVAGLLSSRLTGLKRLTLVAPPALAAALIATIVVWGLPISGHGDSSNAVAARITQALAVSAPTVTAWSVKVEQQRGNSTAAIQCSPQLGASQRVYIKNNRAYLWSKHTWFQITQSSPLCAGTRGWEWAFATLPARLAHDQLSVLTSKTINGHRADVLRYSVSDGTTTVTSTYWVEHASGLVLKAERVQQKGDRVIERDTASYSYTRAA